jgi:hypothetical protein
MDCWYFHIVFQIALLLHKMLTKLITYCVVGNETPLSNIQPSASQELGTQHGVLWTLCDYTGYGTDGVMMVQMIWCLDLIILFSNDLYLRLLNFNCSNF